MMLLILPGFERLFTLVDAKNEINVKKHGISFEKASDVFSDPHALSRVERIENGEERWQTIGMVGEILILLVVYTLRTNTEDCLYTEEIRIISARKADRKERKAYDKSIF